MNRSKWLMTLSGLTLVSMLFGAACDKQTPVKPGDSDVKAESVETADAADPKACEEYSTKFCETVGGDQNPSCVAFKSVSPLLPPAACQAGLKDLEFTKTQVAEMGKKCTFETTPFDNEDGVPKGTNHNTCLVKKALLKHLLYPLNYR